MQILAFNVHIRVYVEIFWILPNVNNTTIVGVAVAVIVGLMVTSLLYVWDDIYVYIYIYTWVYRERVRLQRILR